jgi:hypothetical protein
MSVLSEDCLCLEQGENGEARGRHGTFEKEGRKILLLPLIVEQRYDEFSGFFPVPFSFSLLVNLGHVRYSAVN